MSSPRPKRNFISVILAILGHLLIILLGGYFLSTEFTIYPFLSSHGFLPYSNIIDQHLPVLIFGPLSIPSWLSTNPYPLLIIFCVITAATDLFLYLSFLRHSLKKPLLWLVVWIIISYWFSGNTLWLETFISLFLAIILYLGKSNRTSSALASGFFFGLALLTKPTFGPTLFLLFIFLRIPLGRFFFAGFFAPILITVFFLLKNNLLSDFVYLTYVFNRQSYVSLASKFPTLRQLVETSIVVVPSLLMFLRRKKFLLVLIILTSFATAFPRFEYVHLQPMLTLLVYLLATEIRPKIPFFTPILIVLLSFFVYRNFRHHYGNFYLDPETMKVAATLKAKPGTSLYVFGGNEMLYPLTNRVPPGLTYIPSLPWYWQDENLAKKMIAALTASPDTPVILKSNATIDGANIQGSRGLIGRYINENYRLIGKIESYQVYQRILK